METGDTKHHIQQYKDNIFKGSREDKPNLSGQLHLFSGIYNLHLLSKCLTNLPDICNGLMTPSGESDNNLAEGGHSNEKIMRMVPLGDQLLPNTN